MTGAARWEGSSGGSRPPGEYSWIEEMEVIMRRLTWIAFGLLLLSALCPKRLLAANHKEFELAWSELSPLILGHEVALVLPDSTRLRGDVIAVSEDTLKLDVTKTSNRAEYPKGQANISRAAISAIDVNNKVGKSGRVIGRTTGGVAGTILGAFIIDSLVDSLGPVSAVSIFASSLGGGVILGQVVGRHFDRKVIHIKIVSKLPETEKRSGNRPDPPQTESRVADVQRPSPETVASEL